MLKTRVIAVIIVRDGQVVQSEKFQHTNVIHCDAYHAVEAFNSWSVDEIVLLNISKNKSTQADFLEIVKHVSKTCFIPLSVGGFIDSLEYASNLIANGADKLVVNSLWHENLDEMKKIVNKFGSQCIIASIDIKKIDNQKMVHIDRGKKNIGSTVEYWADFCAKQGAGEILLNNIDYDGNRGGYDLDAIRSIASTAKVPIIAFGGVFSWQDMLDGLNAGADAVAAANIFHYKEMATKQAKRFLKKYNIKIRE